MQENADALRYGNCLPPPLPSACLGFRLGFGLSRPNSVILDLGIPTSITMMALPLGAGTLIQTRQLSESIKATPTTLEAGRSFPA